METDKNDNNNKGKNENSNNQKNQPNNTNHKDKNTSNVSNKSSTASTNKDTGSLGQVPTTTDNANQNGSTIIIDKIGEDDTPKNNNNDNDGDKNITNTNNVKDGTAAKTPSSTMNQTTLCHTEMGLSCDKHEHQCMILVEMTLMVMCKKNKPGDLLRTRSPTCHTVEHAGPPQTIK